MKAFLQTYWLYIKTFLRARAEYRVGFSLGLFSNFYCYFITYCTYWVLVKGVGTVDGWNFSDLSILYGLSLLTYAISGTLIWYTVYHLEEMITKGELDTYLTRPLGVMEQMIFQRFGDTFLGQIVVSALFLAVAFFTQANKITFVRGVYLVLSMIGGTLIQMGGMIFVGALSFWMKRSSALGGMFYYDFRNVTQYPLSIFPKWIQIFLTFVLPWAFINYYPALILTNKVQNNFELAMGLLVPVVGGIFFGVSLKVFNWGLRNYSGAGS